MFAKTASLVLLCVLSSVAHATQDKPLQLFTKITPSDAPPAPDSLTVWNSSFDVVGLANMPTVVNVHIPRETGDLYVNVTMETMDRRQGFGERDPVACRDGDQDACTIVAIPGFPPEKFSYTWIGQGNGYEMRLTVHQGYAVGVISGEIGRFAVYWDSLHELNQPFFNLNDNLPDQGSASAQVHEALVASTSSPPTVWTDEKVSAATVGRMKFKAPSTIASNTQLDLLILVTNQARIQAGGSPSDCRDMTGAMTYIYQNINSMNTAFARSLIPAQIGGVTVARLNGYTVVPYAGNPATIVQNLRNIQGRPNIENFRNLVGADVVSTLLDTQANLGVCGASFIQRANGCGVAGSTCTNGAAFSNWTYLLETIQCGIVDTFTHELGHTLGAEHDPFNSSVGSTPGLASFTYSFGYPKPGTGGAIGFETIMSQQLDPAHYYRLLQFSNPNVTYKGIPTGDLIASTTVASHYNALTLTNLAPFTAAFRSRPNLIFASGFDEAIACPAVNW